MANKPNLLFLNIVDRENKMKAAILKGYSKKTTDLTIVDLPKPQIASDEVLVKVKAAGLNPLDNKVTSGAIKFLIPYDLPMVAGHECVGTIEELGGAVTGFQKGQRVFARLPIDKPGAFAEYVSVPFESLALVPDYLSDEEAACVPLTALTAMQAYDLMKVRAGGTIFISGGTGGVGTMAIPLAKAMGLKVITSGNGKHKDRILALGADQFVDYTKQDYVDVVSNVDYVLDTLGGKELLKQFSILKEGGQLVTLNGLPNGAFAKRFELELPKWKQWVFNLVGRKYDKLASKKQQTYHFIFVTSNGRQLQSVADILAASQVRPSVDSVFDFSEVNKALDKLAHGHTRGKIIVKMS